MNVEEWLKEVKTLDDLINSKLLERKRLEALATDTSVRLPDGMPHSNTGMVSKKVENAVIEMITLDDEINKLTDRFIDHKKRVMAALKQLPRTEYDVLHARYICYMKWELIAEDLNYSVPHLRRIKNRALEDLSQIVSDNEVI